LRQESSEQQIRLKLGGLVNVKNRAFAVRRLALRPTVATDSASEFYCLGEAYTRDCSDKLFQDDNIPDLLRVQETPNQGDFYQAHLNVYAAYAMADWAPSDALRVAAGTRVEWTDQGVDPQNPLQASGTTESSRLREMDVLPSVSLIYSPTSKTKTRASYGRTLARPQVREIAPFGFSDYFGGRTTTG